MVVLCLPVLLQGQSFPAISLNGTNASVQIPNPLQFGTSEDFSLEVRVRTAGWVEDPAILSDKDWNSGKNKGFVISGKTDGQSWKFNVGDGANRIDLNNGGKINDNLWHTLTITFDRDGAKRMYQDGRLLQTNNTVFTGDITSPLPKLGIGQDGTGNYSTYFNGQVAEVRIWSMALDSATVAAWTCQKVSNQHPNYAALLYYWDFHEGMGAKTTDLIGAIEGALLGGASWSTGQFEQANAGFNAVPGGLNVDFTNTSTAATFYQWNFGDGSTSTVENPSHVYAQPGAYAVTLVASGPCSSQTITKNVTVSNGASNNELHGPGKTLDFDGVNDYVLHPNVPALKMTQALTVEGWVFVRSAEQWESFMSFAQDNGSNESGYDFSYVNDKLRFRCKTVTMAANEWDNNPGAEIPFNQWMHVAGVYDGAEMRMYLNGVLAEKQAKTGAINWQYNPIDMRIGAYHDDNEDYFFDGKIDEVRIWNVARTEDQLRAAMCTKLKGNEAGLVGYWRFDESNGATTKDRSTTALDGTLTNMVAANARVLSGAAIGDQSVYAYPADWTNQTLSLPGGTLGVLTVQQVQGAPAGMHLYRIDTLELSSVPSKVIVLSGDYHWGVFATSAATYIGHFNYSGNTLANSAEPVIGFGVRNNEADPNWTAYTGNLNTSTDVLEAPFSGNRQLVLATADFTSICPFQGQVSKLNAGFDFITLEWGSVQNLSTLEYGLSGFTLGSGVKAVGVTGAQYTATGLSADTAYDFYIRDSCTIGGLASVWFGPYTFRTSACQAPSNILVSNITNSSATLNWNGAAGVTYDLQWGPLGFGLGIGIQYPGITAPYVLDGLAANKSYDFYLRASCAGAGDSGWTGPFNFTTKTVDTQDLAKELGLEIFPNPAGEQVWVRCKAQTVENCRLIQLNGVEVHFAQQRLQNNQMVLNLNSVPAGLYLLDVYTEKGRMTEKLVVVK